MCTILWTFLKDALHEAFHLTFYKTIQISCHLENPFHKIRMMASWVKVNGTEWTNILKILLVYQICMCCLVSFLTSCEFSYPYFLIHVTLSVPSAIQVGFMYIFIKYSHKMCQCKNDCHKWFSVSPPHTLLLAPITVLLRSMHALHIELVASTAQTTPSCGLIMFPLLPKYLPFCCMASNRTMNKPGYILLRTYRKHS